MKGDAAAIQVLQVSDGGAMPSRVKRSSAQKQHKLELAPSVSKKRCEPLALVEPHTRSISVDIAFVGGERASMRVKRAPQSHSKIGETKMVKLDPIWSDRALSVL